MEELIEELKQDIYTMIEEFIEEHPEIDKEEIWTAIENLIANR